MLAWQWGAGTALGGRAGVEAARSRRSLFPCALQANGHTRLVPTAEEISALPKLTLDPPIRNCHDELLRPELCAVVPRMDVLVEDVEFKALQLAYEDLPVQLPPNEMAAVIAYTYDSQSGKAEGQLYYELNKALRKRKPEERKQTLAMWGGFLYYLLSALAKLEDVQTVVYRGYPDKATVVEKYTVGRPIQWGAFSSASRDVAVTKQFTNKANGVIFKLTLCAGKAIQAYSYFAAEAEVLISPQARFTVASAPYEGADGYTYVDMVEMKGTLFIS
jgi:hypothetical protein